MASLSEHQTTATKLLLIGESGTGKTCALASLADAGYNVRILDLDNGIDALKSIILDLKSPYKNHPASRIDVQTRMEEMRMINGVSVPTKGNVWDRIGKTLTDWRDEPIKVEGKSVPSEKTLGNISTWTGQDVLVIDSLTMLATAAMYWQQAMNGELGTIYDGFKGMKKIGLIQAHIERLLQLLYSDAIKCNVVVISHVSYIEDKTVPQTVNTKTGEIEERPKRGFPSSIGAALSPRIPRYFNSMLIAEAIGTRRMLLTRSNGIIPVKNTAPLSVPPSYPIETGLASYFADIRKSTGK